MMLLHLEKEQGKEFDLKNTLVHQKKTFSKS
jgi:hypothetical protein